MKDEAPFDWQQYPDKVKTHIPGFDHLLFGGIDFVPKNIVITIKSDEPVHGTLMGLQLLYGISQSLIRKSRKEQPHHSTKTINIPCISHFLSTSLTESFMNNLVLNTVISSCIREMKKRYVSYPKDADSNFPHVGNGFTDFFFQKFEDPKAISDSDMQEIVAHDTDALICEEAVVYHNRTGSLHLRTSDSIALSDIADPFIFHRRYESYSEFYKDSGHSRSKIETDLDFPLARLNFICNPLSGNDFSLIEEALENIRNKKHAGPVFVAIDMSGDNNTPKKKSREIKRLMDTYLEDYKLLILIVPPSCDIPMEKTDLVIELTNAVDSEFSYFLRKMRIQYSRRQSTALGWHYYKFRDYGLEFFPSLHTYFQRRRYLQNALINTHSPVVTDTYLQYVDRMAKDLDLDDENDKKKIASLDFKTYLRNRSTATNENIQSLYTDYTVGLSAVNILEQILIPHGLHSHDKRDPIMDYKGCVTAVIGSGNTYKRFITFGSIFSSSIAKEHTLILLMNKDSDTVRRRLSCPARAKRGLDCKHCHECYKYIHFMDIYMGNITADEFIYYLKQQLETKYDDGKRIQRIVIDDLQIVDFCFPFLLRDNLFLSALTYICKDLGVYSYILCDKMGKKVQELRAVADNIICTGRDGKGKLQLYIERFIGFNNTPSKVYCGSVDKAKNLFECYYKIEAGNKKHWYYRLNSMQIDDNTINSMEDYWK